MKHLFLATLALTTTAALNVSAAEDWANDNYSGAHCVPSRHAGSDLVVGAGGFVRNDGDSRQLVRCPVTVPYDTRFIEVTVQAGYYYGYKASERDQIQCSLFRTHRGTYEGSETVTVRDEDEWLPVVLHLRTSSQSTDYIYSVSCKLPPSAVIWGYDVFSSAVYSKRPYGARSYGVNSYAKKPYQAE